MPAVALYSDAFFADPIAYYERLREEDPVHWNEEHQVWLVTRHADVSMLTKAPQHFSSALATRDQRPPLPPIPEDDRKHDEYVRAFRTHEFIQMDPPEHGVKRDPLAGRFAARELEPLRGMVRSVIDELLDSVIDHGSMNLLDALARPLPLIVIARLMGIDPNDAPLVAAQAQARMASVLSLAPDRMRVSADGFSGTADYLSRRLDSAVCRRADNVLGDVARAEDEQVYCRAESLANTMLLIDAGHETTIQLICNGTLLLMQHREEWQRLVADPEGLSRRAVEECLRFDPPLHAFRRVAAGDVELGGRTLREGDAIQGVIVSANRDPRRFDQPARFDVGRERNPHVSFGAGAHYCLGQYLARIEGQEYLRAVASRLPDLRLRSDATVSYFSTPRVRSMTGLQLEWTPH